MFDWVLNMSLVVIMYTSLAECFFINFIMLCGSESLYVLKDALSALRQFLLTESTLKDI